MSPTEVLSSLFVIVFVVEIITIVIILIYRMLEYRRARWKQPVLLGRDFVLFLSFVPTILAIFIRRAFDLDVVNEIWWVLGTSLPPVIGLAWWIRQELKLGK